MKQFVILLAIAVGLFRPALLFIEVNDHVQSSYEALAHILVGGLFAWYFANDRLWKRTNGGQEPLSLGEFQWTLYTAIILTIVEVVCAGIGFATK